MKRKETKMARKRIKKVLGLGLAVILTGSLIIGCGKEEKAAGGEGGQVVIAGSTSVQPLSEAIAKEYMKDHKNVKITVQGGGSGQAVKSIKEGIAKIGALSREVKSDEKADAGKEYVFAKDGVAVVVHKGVKVDNLTMEQIKKIYTGEITNWKELGGEDAPIAVVTREEGSGTRGAFTEITGVMAKNAGGNEIDKTTTKAIVQPSTGAALETVKSTPYSVGYVSLEALNDSVKAVSIEGIKISKETVLDGTYKISRPFIYIVGKKVDTATQEFIDFVMSNAGQKLIEKNGFIPVKPLK